MLVCRFIAKMLNICTIISDCFPSKEYNTDAESDQSESEGTDDHDDLLPSKVRKGWF